MRPGRPRHTRRGAALAWALVIIALALLGWGLSRSLVTASARGESVAASEAATCRLLAESAVAEMEARAAARLNDPASPTAAALHRVPLALVPADANLTDQVRPSGFESMLEGDAFREYRLEEARCRVAFTSSISGSPEAYDGLLVARAVVRAPGLVRPVSRRVEVARWMKITRVAVPRPFGDRGITIADATGLTDPARANRARERLEQDARALVALLIDLRDRPGAVRATWEELVGAALDPARPGTMPGPVDLPAGAALHGLVAPGERQDLTTLDIGRKLEELEKIAAAAVAQLQAAASSAGPPGDDAVQKATQAVRAVLDAASELWVFHARYRVAARGTAEHGAIAGQIYQIDPAHIRRLAIARLSGEPATLQTRLDRWLAAGTSGVVCVDNPDGVPVRLGGIVRGRVVVAVGPGGADVRDLNPPSAAAGGMVTVHATTGRLRIAGECSVAVMIAPPPASSGAVQLSIDPGARLRGVLLMSEVPPGAGLAGTLARDERHAGEPGSAGPGPDLATDARHVALSPRIHYRRVE